MDSPKQEFEIRDLPTKSVTLYPARAHIVREIESVSLRPGQNEIEIYGLTPTVDDQSVQVDGRGAATITDITVSLVPNRVSFQEIYPDEFDQQDPEEEDEIVIQDCDEVKRLEAEVDQLKTEATRYREVISSAAKQLEVLDAYSRSLKAENNNAEDVVKTIAMYEEQRGKIFISHRDASDKLKTTETTIKEKEKAKHKAGVADRKLLAERQRSKAKEDERKSRQRRERHKQALRIKEERLKFYPKKVYKVTVTLEAPLSISTPATSRRGSFDSVTLAAGEDFDSKDKSSVFSDGDSTTVSLSLSYDTRDASWTPRYDISVSSVQKSATIVYRAELVNGTSETWKNTQLILSTSQTSYGGLEDKVPVLHPWHIRLGGKFEQSLLSPEEMSHPRRGKAHVVVPDRSELFGSKQQVFLWGNKIQQQQQQRQMGNLFPPQSNNAMVAPQGSYNTWANPAASNNTASSFGAAQAMHSNTSGALFGTSGRGFGSTAVDRATNIAPVQASSFASRHMRRSAAAPGAAHTAGPSDGSDEEESALPEAEGLAAYAPPPPGTITYQEATWEDDGLTSTYEVPGTRTLAPSSLTRRHRIASLNATSIHLSHIAVPKLQSAAFLRAKIRNPSSTVTLLKGTAGVTLDSAFLGNMTMARVAPAQVFDLPLGVDPAVAISYPKPSVHRSTQGVFNRESTQVFSRNVWITNSKAAAVEITVLDQVPVSEDERLGISIVEPRGLKSEGDAVRTGTAAKEGAVGRGGGEAVSGSAAKKVDWGKATATLKKDGQVAWNVSLEKKMACLLKLEYETRMPAAENIVSVPQ